MACAKCPDISPARRLPSVLTQARTAVAAFARVGNAVFHGRETIVSPAIFRQRMAKCLACVECVPAANPKYHRCALCGCFLDRKNKIDAKAWLTTERCPLDQPKWEAIA